MERGLSRLTRFFSLEQCKRNGHLPSSAKFRPWEKKLPYDAPPYRALEVGIEITLNSSAEVGAIQVADLGELLERCPILERDSALIFGNLLGKNANIISAGKFSISSFISEKGAGSSTHC